MYSSPLQSPYLSSGYKSRPTPFHSSFVSPLCDRLSAPVGLGSGNQPHTDVRGDVGSDDSRWEHKHTIHFLPVHSSHFDACLKMFLIVSGIRNAAQIYNYIRSYKVRTTPYHANWKIAGSYVVQRIVKESAEKSYFCPMSCKGDTGVEMLMLKYIIRAHHWPQFDTLQVT